MWSWLEAIDELHEILGTGAVLIVVSFAFVVGRRAERWAAAIALFDAFALALFSAVLDHAERLPLVHLKAALVLLAYCAMVVRWSHGWLILLAGLQAFAVLLHAAVWIDRSIVIPANALLLNGVGWLMLAILLGAAVAEAGRRRGWTSGPR